MITLGSASERSRGHSGSREKGLAQLLLGGALLALLLLQVGRINPPHKYLVIGEKAPFGIVQAEGPITQVAGDCLTTFIVSVGCPHSGRLADSFSPLDKGDLEPLWIVMEGWEAAENY